ncbi:RagB/SusD family nutrient uptake outer membrane protein [Parapedobacter koreensis]|uniref:Starch-binding associating with outer membrane n=1 Tax=Parapedobacter koreensis TaxID=332977 RepID=A0A1H7PHY4_9SPHI|nr:RagB/SusD family nutrient uptake outer membrane protein [Parapedobacter koreensis]SEL35390.1 Starch-binding associating with outer membrane [Parapedobacter koreensis]
MKKIAYITMLVFVMANTISCQKSFLDKQPLDQYSADNLWNDLGLVEIFVNDIYGGIPHGFSVVTLSAVVDESMYRFETSDATNSLITPSYLSSFTADGMAKLGWESIYGYIRACNLLLEQIDNVPTNDEAFRNRLKGEGHFLRAHLYHNLVSMYGGVPLITQAYTLEDEFLVSRNTYEECIQFISEECDRAAELLPLVQTDVNVGRATKGAALALKSRALLYAASDLANNTSWTGGYHPELVGHIGGDRTARWLAAKNAAKAVMDLGVYELHGKDPAPGDDVAANYGNIFTSYGTSEDIFVKFFTIRSNMDGYNPGLYANPNGWNGWGIYTPIGQMADAYETRDGNKFDWNNPSMANAPYENRDPRFYASINYNGAPWRPRPTEVVSSDPEGVIQTAYYERWNSATNSIVTVPGLDTREGPLKNWNGTYTGYYQRKYINPALDGEFVKQDFPWRHFRYAEILLNYAEACMELGEDGEARTYLNRIRKRAGMPDITEAGDALVDRYRNERRVELAFEGHRYFDVRRWMIAEEAYADAEGIEIVYPLNPDRTTSTTAQYTVVNVQGRTWNPRFYFLPITIEEMNRNKELIQNPLY